MTKAAGWFNVFQKSPNILKKGNCEAKRIPVHASFSGSSGGLESLLKKYNKGSKHGDQQPVTGVRQMLIS